MQSQRAAPIVQSKTRSASAKSFPKDFYRHKSNPIEIGESRRDWNTGFGELEAVGGLVEEIGGVLVLGAEQPPAVQLLLRFLLVLVPSRQLIPHLLGSRSPAEDWSEKRSGQLCWKQRRVEVVVVVATGRSSVALNWQRERKREKGSQIPREKGPVVAGRVGRHGVGFFLYLRRPPGIRGGPFPKQGPVRRAQ